jgi:hypothetical protein
MSTKRKGKTMLLTKIEHGEAHVVFDDGSLAMLAQICQAANDCLLETAGAQDLRRAARTYGAAFQGLALGCAATTFTTPAALQALQTVLADLGLDVLAQ